MTRTSASVTELRVALVCYGGVSLAIYMHGITKEIHKLVRASRAFDAAWERDTRLTAAQPPFPDTDEFDTERAYFAALVALAEAGRPITVVVDVIAGTSAGGINGVFLARALAENRSLAGLRRIWLEDGDLNVLLREHLVPLGGRVGLVAHVVESMIHLAGHRDDAPLDGALMSRLLHGALAEMPTVGESSLVRPENGLDLMTTATDVHGHQTILSTGADRPVRTDRSFRQALRFGPGEESGYGDAEVDALAFAARATSSFPGAFPPVSVASFLDELGEDGPEGRDADRRRGIAGHFVFGDDLDAHSEAWFMDGGVLDNGPFDLCIDLIAEKRADRPTARELVYIEPDPREDEQTGGRPSWTDTVWAARVTVPQHTPFVAALDDVRVMNETIAQVGALVAEAARDVEGLLAAVTGEDGSPERLTYEQAREYDDRVRVHLHAGPAYPSYTRLRAEGFAGLVGVALARTLGWPARSHRARLLAEVLTAWARRAEDPDRVEGALDAADLSYRLRRAEFVLQGVNELFDDLPDTQRADLVTIKQACWDLITRLRDLTRDAAAEVTDEAADLLTALTTTSLSPESFARAHHAELAELARAFRAVAVRARGSSEGLWTALTRSTRTWDATTRTALLRRYLGFAAWDLRVYPTITLAKLPQLAPVEVSRFSPLDATCLAPTGTPDERRSKRLKGAALGHFGGFFKLDWRQHDYLWGRLDGVELLLGMLQRHTPGSDVDLTALRCDGFAAVLDSEQRCLTEIEDEFADLTRRVREARTAGRAGRTGPS